MKKPTQYYLFKSGGLVGPITPEKLEFLRKSGEIHKYSWLIDDSNQSWSPVVETPTENPFLKTKEFLNERDLSGVFVFMKKPYLGIVKGIHSFGLELLIQATPTLRRSLGIQPESVLQLNLADETNGNAVNAKVVFQSCEDHAEGILLRLGWLTAPVLL